MLDSQEIIISIDKRLTAARKEIASLEGALTAMRKPSKAAGASRTARRNGTAPANATAPAKDAAPATEPPSAPAEEPASTPAKAKQKASANGAPPAAARPRRARRSPAKRRAEVVPAGKLVTLLGASDGMSTADLVDQTGGDRQQLLTLLRELEAAGEVRRSGERRNTRWHVITDEDRIAARVAELERQSSRRTQKA